jgi:thiol-disulfide isomerase/thioredoxin
MIRLAVLVALVSLARCTHVFADDRYDQAVKESQIQQRPILVVLGAEWCSWCRKLESEMATPAATSTLDRWVVVKVDVDASPDIAEKLNASALPALRILRSDQSLVAGREGYLPLEELTTWLDENMAEADPAIQRILYETGALDEAGVKRLIEFLGHRTPEIRSIAEERLTVARADSLGSVVDTFRTGGLLQKLGSQKILQRWGAPVSDLDPWVPSTMDAKAMEPVLVWLRDRQADMDAEDGPQVPAAEFDEQAVRLQVSSLLTAEESSRPGLIAQLVSVGDGIVPELKLRLETGDALTDDQRQLLREVLYKVLVGTQTRIQRSGVLVGLASLDADTHRRSAIELMKHVTSQDQPLVDELSNDGDVLVRESAVEPLARIGALNDPDRLRKLLDDPNPSVRTAALRSLAKKPLDPLIDTLVDYLEKESDEDLLVYATKTLGELGSSERASQALVVMAGNPAWRVRAAALDAIKERMEDRRNQYFDPFSGSKKTLPKGFEKLTSSVLRAAKDEDAFVAEKAIALVPSIITTTTAPEICDFLLDNPDRLAVIDKDLSEYEREASFSPLTEHLKAMLQDSDPRRSNFAARGLLKFEPKALRNSLPVLLASDDLESRIVGVRSLLVILAGVRDEAVMESHAANFTRLKGWNHPERTPLHTVPDSFLVLPPPTSPAHSEDPTETTVEKELKIAAADDAQLDDLDIFGSFFGGSTDAVSDPEEIAESIPSVNSEADVADDSEATDLDLAMDLFGDIVIEPETPQVPEAAMLSATDPPESESSLKMDGSTSQWLAKWQTNGPSKPFKQCVEVMRERLTAMEADRSDVEIPLIELEARWLRLGLLACGLTEYADAVVAAADSPLSMDNGPTSFGAPTRLDHWPWLREDQRAPELAKLEIDFSKLTSTTETEHLSTITEIDDHTIANWLLNEISALPTMTKRDVSTASMLLLRSLSGTIELSDWQSKDQLESGPLAFPQFRSASSIPKYDESVDWICERYAACASRFGRAVLLSILTHYDHRLAAQSAVGLIYETTEDATADDPLMNMALGIALSDAVQASADRAAQWLGHPNETVRTRALDYLVSPSSVFEPDSVGTGAVYFLDSQDRQPGFWYVNRKIDRQTIGELAENEIKEIHRAAKLLLLAQGDESRSPRELQELDWSPEIVMAALVKAGRTDAAAVEYYRSTIDSASNRNDVYQTLKLLPGEIGLELRKVMRDKFGSEVLQSF